MKVTDFIDELEKDINLNKSSFITNMSYLKEDEHTFCEWVDMFIRWMEWGTDEDCERYYGQRI